MRVYQQVFTFRTPELDEVTWYNRDLYQNQQKAVNELQKVWEKVKEDDEELDSFKVITLYLDDEL